jgi:hypothetical protein
MTGVGTAVISRASTRDFFTGCSFSLSFEVTLAALPAFSCTAARFVPLGFGSLGINAGIDMANNASSKLSPYCQKSQLTCSRRGIGFL